MDDYCIALLLLALFLLYIDNQNKSEGYLGYGPLNEQHIKLSGSDQPGGVKPVEGSKPQIQDYKPIGQVPQKVDMAPPSSMSASMETLLGAPVDMKDYMLLHEPGDVYDVVGADLPMAYPRVGAPDNLGRDTSFHEEEDDTQLHDPYDTQDQHAPIDTGPKAPAGVVGAGTFKAVIIYAPWCGWSKKSLPDFEKMNSTLNSLPSNQTNGWDVSCELYDSETPEGEKKVKEYGVDGFPAVITEVNGEKQDGPRDFDSMMQLMKDTTGSN